MNAREYGVKLLAATHKMALTPMKAAILLVMADGMSRDRNTITRMLGWGECGGYISRPIAGMIRHYLLEEEDELGYRLRITDKGKKFALQMMK